MMDIKSFYAALETSPSAMFFVNSVGKILYANVVAQDLFLYTADEFVGMEMKSLLPEKTRAEEKVETPKAVDDTGQLFLEERKTFPAVRKDERRIVVDAKITQIRYEDADYLVYGLMDLSEQQAIEDVIREQANQLVKANRRLSHLASTDALTGLKNRREMMLQLEALLVDATIKEISISLIMMDIDHFKAYNDAFGHMAGDILLRNFADLLQVNARDEDIVARYGGEEFVLMFSGNENQAEQIAERLRVLVDGKAWPLRKVTISLGVMTMFPHLDPGDVDTLMTQLIDHADQAMYHSKALGRNRATSYESLQKAK